MGAAQAQALEPAQELELAQELEPVQEPGRTQEVEQAVEQEVEQASVLQVPPPPPFASKAGAALAPPLRLSASWSLLLPALQQAAEQLAAQRAVRQSSPIAGRGAPASGHRSAGRAFPARP